jgi:hypothetical protein
VAVGGNRVESMTIEQIAHAFHSGHLNVRTPLWPPGATGWQALGNFPEFQVHPSAYADPGLAQFVEADDDPTRMWTGGNDLASMEASMQAPFGGRPTAQTGVRQVASPRSPQPAHNGYMMQAPAAPNAYAMQAPPVPNAYAMQAPPVPSRPAPMHSQPVPSQPMPSRPAPTASVASHQPALVPSSMPPFRSKSRGNGLMLVVGLVGLVGLGSAVLAARGSWGSPPERANEVAVAAATPVPSVAAETQAPAAEAPKAGEAQLAKYEDTSAFVAGQAKPAANEVAAAEAKPEEAGREEAKADAPAASAPSSDEAQAKAADADEHDEPTAKSDMSSSKSARIKNDAPSSKRLSAR